MERDQMLKMYCRKTSHVDGVLGKESKEKLVFGCPLGLYLTQDLDYRKVVVH